MTKDTADSQTTLRQEAITRLRKKREFLQHITAYVVVNVALTVVWLLTDPDGFYWPVFPLLGWGIGVVFHGIDTYSPVRPPERRIQREMRRLANR